MNIKVQLENLGFSTYTCEDGEQIHEWLTCGGSKDPSYKNMLDIGGKGRKPHKICYVSDTSEVENPITLWFSVAIALHINSLCLIILSYKQEISRCQDQNILHNQQR